MTFLLICKTVNCQISLLHGLLKGGRDELDTSEWKIDVSDVVDIVKNNNKGFMDQLDDAAVIILHTGKRKWTLDVLKIQILVEQ